MAYNRLFHTAFFLVFIYGVFSATYCIESDTLTISSIQISGNKRTKNQYLERFIETQAGQRPDSLTINEDLRRLRNLAPVMLAEAWYEPADSGGILHYDIVERYTLLPVGDFGITDDNFWVGGGLMESNLFGRGLYTYGYYQYNQRHTLHLIFRNPYIAGSQWGFELQLRKLPSKENSTEFIEYCIKDYFNLSLAVSYEYQLEKIFLLGTAYRKEKLDYQGYIYPIGDEILITPPREAQVFFLQHKSQKLDQHTFYIDGWNNNAYFSILVPYASSDDQVKVSLVDEIKLYKRIGGKINLGFRAMAGLSSYDWHYYQPFIADSYYNLRGIGYRSYRGNIAGFLNVEYRHTLYENRWGGIQAILFNDSGLISETDGIFNFSAIDLSSDLKTFGGAGLRLIYKKAYNAILSIDYGFDLQNLWNGGWVIGWGQYF